MMRSSGSEGTTRSSSEIGGFPLAVESESGSDDMRGLVMGSSGGSDVVGDDEVVEDEVERLEDEVSQEG